MHRDFRLIKKMGWMVRQLISKGLGREEAIETIKKKISLDHECMSSTARFVPELGPLIGLLWYDCGFPVVEVGQKLGASLMATKWSADVADCLNVPWGCFLVNCYGITKTESALLFKMDDTNYVTLSVGSLCTATGSFPKMSQMLSVKGDSAIVGEEDLWGGSPPSMTELERDALLVGRLLLGVCAELTNFDDKPRPRVHGHGKRHSGLGRQSLEPKCWDIQLTRPVKIDVRKEIVAYAGGAKRSPTVQTCVCGHWKWQPHGKGSTERKWIHVEPYWRGPEDAPIAVRSHTLTK